jgi:hypothetical protein
MGTAFGSKEQLPQGRFVFDLGNGQWDLSQLRKLLPQVPRDSHPVEAFDSEHAFPAVGRTNLPLNARRFAADGDDAEWILLAIEDDSDHRWADAVMKVGG